MTNCALFLQYCQRTGLDPFSRQIYLSERRSKDQKTGNWITKRQPETTVGRIPPHCGAHVAVCRPRGAVLLWRRWCGRDVWLDSKPPMAAKVGVLRHDFKQPLYAVAHYSEYVQTTGEGRANSMWSKMPSGQLGKCAESLALRRAFPRELSGLYSREEMGQADNPEPAGSKQAAQEVAQRKIAELSAPQVANFDPNSGTAPISARIIEEVQASKEREAEQFLESIASEPQIKEVAPRQRSATVKRIQRNPGGGKGRTSGHAQGLR